MCQQCDAGQLPSADKTSCGLCPAGKYSAAPGLSACQPCPAGTFRNAQGDGTQCTNCPPGSWSDAGAADCTPCAPGTATENEGVVKDPTTGSCPAW